MQHLHQSKSVNSPTFCYTSAFSRTSSEACWAMCPAANPPWAGGISPVPVKTCLIEEILPLLKSDFDCPGRLDNPRLYQQELQTPVNRKGKVIHRLLWWKFLTLRGLSWIKPLSLQACPALSWLDSVCCSVTLLLTALLLPKCKVIYRQEE